MLASLTDSLMKLSFLLLFQAEKAIPYSKPTFILQYNIGMKLNVSLGSRLRLAMRQRRTD